MIKNRVIYLALLISSGIYVYYLPSTISATIFYMMVLIPLCSLFYTWIAYITFKVSQDISTRNVLKGNDTRLTCTIYNDSVFLFPPMELKLIDSSILFNGTIKREEFILPPNSSKELIYPVQCKYRGSYSIGIYKVIIKDPFRLFSFGFKRIEPIKITVYPHIIEINKVELLLESFREDTLFNNLITQDSHSISEIRSYRMGDSSKNIHWKISAKMNEWMVKSKKENLKRKCTVLADTTILNISKERRLFLEDYCIEQIVGHIKVFIDMGIPTRLLFHDKNRFDYLGVSKDDFASFYRELAEVNYTSHCNTNDLLKHVVNDKLNGITIGMLHIFTLDICNIDFDILLSSNINTKSVFIHYVIDNRLKQKEKNIKYRIVEEMQEKGLTINMYVPS